MNLSRIDRNRLTVVTIVTMVAVPLLWIANAGSGSGTETTIDPEEVVTTSTLQLGLSTDITADSPVNLDGPSPEAPVGTGQIAYPADNDGQMRRGIATYKRFPDVAKTGCATNLIPLGAVITVRNLNNGRKVECTNLNIGYVPPNVDLVLHTELFEDMAELKEAPLPVEMTW
jgi:hypothetical protein